MTRRSQVLTAIPIQQRGLNIDSEQNQFDVGVKVLAFPDFKQNNESESTALNALNASGNIKLGGT